MAAPIYNNQPYEPELKDVLEAYKRDAMLSTNCHALVTVVSFNPYDEAITPPRATITAILNYPKTFFAPSQNTQIPTPTTIPYSQLVSVPVVILSGGGGNSQGGASLTFPIKPGDQAIVLFNDRSIDNWKGGITATVNDGIVTPCNTSLSSSRTHHLSDGLAIVGLPLFPESNGALPAYDPDRAILSNGAAQVGVNGANGKVLITNDPTKASNLNAILQDLVTAVEELQLSLANINQFIFTAPNGPVTVTGGPAAITTSATTTLSQIATSLGDLLE